MRRLDLQNPFNPVIEAEILGSLGAIYTIGNLITKTQYLEAPIKDLKEKEVEAHPFFIKREYYNREFFSTFKKISGVEIEYKFNNIDYVFLTIPNILKNGNKKYNIMKYYKKMYKSLKKVDNEGIFNLDFSSENIKDYVGIFPFSIIYFMDKFIVYHIDNSYNRKVLSYEEGLKEELIFPDLGLFNKLMGW